MYPQPILTQAYSFGFPQQYLLQPHQVHPPQPCSDAQLDQMLVEALSRHRLAPWNQDGTVAPASSKARPTCKRAAAAPSVPESCQHIFCVLIGCIYISPTYLGFLLK